MQSSWIPEVRDKDIATDSGHKLVQTRVRRRNLIIARAAKPLGVAADGHFLEVCKVNGTWCRRRSFLVDRRMTYGCLAVATSESTKHQVVYV